jgi:hypothetical protein
MHKPGQKCTKLIEKTGNELSSSVVALMLLAVQKDNLELSINYAVQQYASIILRVEQGEPSLIIEPILHWNKAIGMQKK